jgi:hypothetical protein
MGSGFSSSVEYEGRRYHLQTQCSARGDPVIESLVFRDGRVLVRFTSSYGDVAQRHGFTEDDGRHLAELQHADLVRKIRHGMLRDDDDTAASSEEPRLLDSEGIVVDPTEVDDPAVQELLRDLGVAIDGVVPPPSNPPPLAQNSIRAESERKRSKD